MATKATKPAAKSQKKSNPASQSASGKLITVVDPPPNPGAPVTPSGYEPLDRKAVAALLKLTANQGTALGAVAQEITSSTTFVADFGSDAGDPTTIANALTAAAEWLAEEANAARWAVYAKDQMHLAEDAAMEVIAPLYDEVQHSVAKHPALAAEYPALVAFVNARSAAAQKGVETRKSKKKASAASASQSATEPVVAAAPVAPAAAQH